MTLRIGAPPPTRGIADEEMHQSEESSSTEGTGAYLERLVKLVPMEVVGAYPIVIQSAERAGPWTKAITSWILLGVVVLIRAYATKTLGRGPQWPAVAIAALSFVIWICVMDGDFGLANLLEIAGAGRESALIQIKYYSNVALVVWTIIIPIIYKGDAS